MTTTYTAESSAVAEFPACKTFDEMDLKESVLRGVFGHGFDKPSPIQSLAIRPLIAGRDVLGQANSGTGKTGTFGIGVLNRIDPELKKTQVLILAHTHELAEQICNVLRNIGSYLKIQIVLAVGGSPRHQNVRDLRAGAQIVVGTPGRVYDLAKAGDLKYADLRCFVLDEADEMLRDRFGDQVGEIIQLQGGLPDHSGCQVAFFSATMPPEVRELADKILKNPVVITLKAAEVSLEGIKQYIVPLEDDSQKLDCICDIFESLSIPQSIVFTNSKDRAERLYKALTDRGFPVSIIYGEPMTQAIRHQRMEEFRSAKTRVLISTNLLARGIDVQAVSVVFNFDLPPFEDKENYIHRIGRCGRFGRKGTAISFLNPGEQMIMQQIASHYSFTPRDLPMDLKGVVDAT